jgi:Bacterial regulatory protein, arsR family.
MESITIRSVEKPDYNDPKALLKWFCTTFGLIESSEGKDSAEEQILVRFIYAARQNRNLSVSDLKISQKMPRSTLIYHLNRLVDAGIISKKGHTYKLRANDISRVVEEINYDVSREFMRILDTAKELDRLIEGSLSETKALKNRGV